LRLYELPVEVPYELPVVVPGVVAVIVEGGGSVVGDGVVGAVEGTVDDGVVAAGGVTRGASTTGAGLLLHAPENKIINIENNNFLLNYRPPCR